MLWTAASLASLAVGAAPASDASICAPGEPTLAAAVNGAACGATGPSKDARVDASAPRHDSPESFVTARPPDDAVEYAAALARLRQTPRADLFAFARYPGAEPREDLGEAARLGGADIRMATLTLPDPMHVVEAHYRQELAKRGMPCRSGRMSPAVWYLGCRDPADGFMRTLTLVRQSQSTMVLAAVGDPARIADGRASSALPADWPMPPVTGRPLDMQFVQGEQVMATRRAQLAVEQGAEVIAFYDRALPPLGWKAETASARPFAGLRFASFQRRAERCSVSVTPGAKHSTVMTVTCISGKGP